jgi:hypothetical protein
MVLLCRPTTTRNDQTRGPFIGGVHVHAYKNIEAYRSIL